MKQFLEKGKAGQKVRVTSTDEHAKTPMSQPVPEENLRQLTRNMLAVSTLFLADDDNQALLRLVVTVCQEADDWHGVTNRSLRDVESSAEWLLRLLTGEFQQHIHAFFKSTRDAGALEYIGFQMPKEETSIDSLDYDMVVDDERAALMGGLARSLAFARCKRLAWLVGGWSNRSALFLSEVHRQTALDDLQADFHYFKELEKAKEAGVIGAGEVHQRSIFHLQCVKQIVLHLEKNGWQCDDELLQFLRRKYRRPMLTQVSEDQNHTARAQEHRATNGKCPPRTVYAMLVEEQVLAKRHDFTEVQHQSNMGCQLGRGRLDAEVFEPSALAQDSSVQFSKMVSTSQTTTWYSPGVEHMALQFRDVALMREVGEDTHLLRNVKWLSCLAGCDVLLKRDGTTQWLLPLGSLPGSASWALPVSERRVPLSDQLFFEPDTSKGPVTLALLDRHAWRARSFVWRICCYYGVGGWMGGWMDGCMYGWVNGVLGVH